MSARFITFLIFQVLLLSLVIHYGASDSSLRALGKDSSDHPLLGEYILRELAYTGGEDVHLPGQYILTISTHLTTLSSATKSADRIFVFRINIRIGNLIGGRLIVDMPADEKNFEYEKWYDAQIGDIFSTRLKVPEDLDVVEFGFEEILPGLYNIAILKNTLTFHSYRGVMVFDRKRWK